jgi:hypothetical protein
MFDRHFSVLCAALLVISFQPELAAQQAEIIVPIVQGVYVDATGVLQTVMVGDPGEQLDNLRRGVPTGRASGAATGKTELRRISLARLAREVRSHIQAGTAIPDEARYLAGIQQIQYLFVYPEEQDLVIAGPAEGWQMDEAGRVVGQQTRRPVVRLDDLIVAMRVFSARGGGNTFVGCSIDQTEEGMRRFNQQIAKLQSAIDRRQVDAALFQNVRDSVGLQNIAVWGVPPDSRLALVLVEADYRMKLIGVGLEDSRVRDLKTYFSMLGPGRIVDQKLQRWWFIPDYDAIITSDNGDAFELLGQRAKLVGADDKLMASGQVVRTHESSGITKRFTQSFSSHFEDLARINPAFSELQNAFDLIVVSALIDANDLVNTVAPDLRYFLQVENGYEPETFPVPRHVASVVNTKWVGNKLAIGVGGGVGIDGKSVVRSVSGKRPANSKLPARRQPPASVGASTSRWWID